MIVTRCHKHKCTHNVSKKSMPKTRFFLTIENIHKNPNHHHIIKQSFVKLNKAYIYNWAPAYHIITTVMRETFPSSIIFPHIILYLNGSGAMHIYIHTLWKDYLYETVYSQQSFSFLITVNVKGKTNFLFLSF